MKKAIGLLLVIVILLGVIPVKVFAEEVSANVIELESIAAPEPSSITVASGQTAEQLSLPQTLLGTYIADEQTVEASVAVNWASDSEQSYDSATAGSYPFHAAIADANYSYTGVMPSITVVIAEEASSVPDGNSAESSESNDTLLDTTPVVLAGSSSSVTTLQQLKDAIIAAPSDNTLYEIEIAADIQLDGELTVAAGKNIKIWSGAKYTITAMSDTRLFLILGKLTLENDITLTGGHAPHTHHVINDAGGGVCIGVDGAFVMNGGVIGGNTADSRGGGVFVLGGSFLMSGGKISGNTAGWGDGGGVYLQSGNSLGVHRNSTFEMTGGEISDNSGNGVNVQFGSTFTMSGTAVITRNDASVTLSGYGYGGGVHVAGTFKMDGGRITDNTAQTGTRGTAGGGVFLPNGTYNGEPYNNAFIMTNGEISGNTGGGVGVVGGTFSMTGGTIKNNILSSPGYAGRGYGTGVHVDRNATFNVSGTAVISNNEGSGVENSGTLKLSGPAEIRENSGNGVLVYENGVFEMTGGNVSGNANDGVSMGTPSLTGDGNTFVMASGTISGNSVGVNVSYGTFTMSDTAIVSGNANTGVSVSGTFTMYGGIIKDNVNVGGKFNVGRKPIINGGVSFSSILIIEDIEVGALVVINGHTAGTTIASYIGSNTLTDAMAKAFVSTDGSLVGKASGTDVVLEEVQLADKNSYTLDIAFSDGYGFSNLPAGLATSAPWLKYKDNISIISLTGVDGIGASAFAGYSGLQKVYLDYHGGSVSTNRPKNIGDYVFKDCVNLGAFFTSSSNITKGVGVFENCHKFTGFDLGIDELYDIGTEVVESGSLGDDYTWTIKKNNLAIGGDNETELYIKQVLTPAGATLSRQPQPGGIDGTITAEINGNSSSQLINIITSVEGATWKLFYYNDQLQYTELTDEKLPLKDGENTAFLELTAPDFDKIIYLVTVYLNKDSDGDALPDKWEKEGVTINGTYIDLPAMGALWDVPDIFVEVDWMPGLRPSESVLQQVSRAFINAPDRTGRGVRLHIDAGPGSVDFVTGRMWGSYPGMNSGGNEIRPDIAVFDLGPVEEDPNGVTTLKGWGAMSDNNFAIARQAIFHHAAFVHRWLDPDAKPGEETIRSGVAINYGQHMLVAVDAVEGAYRNDPDVNSLRTALSGTFMHELGHHLLGGDSPIDTYNELYLSVMSYEYQFTGLGGDRIDYSGGDWAQLRYSGINSEIGNLASRGNSTVLPYDAIITELTTEEIIAILDAVDNDDEDTIYAVTNSPSAWSGAGDAAWTIDAPFNEFIRLTLGGNEIAEDNYTKVAGSLIITLKESYIKKTLAAGTYTFRAEFTNGYADLTLIVQTASTPVPTPTIPIRTPETPPATTVGSPQTGDSNNTVGWTITFSVSLAAIFALSAWRRRYHSKKVQ